MGSLVCVPGVPVPCSRSLIRGPAQHPLDTRYALRYLHAIGDLEPSSGLAILHTRPCLLRQA